MESNKSGIPEVSQKQITGIMIGMFLAIFANCDSSIVSTASVTMLADLGNENLYTLILSIRLITMVIACLVSGKMADRAGRKKVVMAGLTIVIIGNICSGFSSNMLMLLISRSVFGIGLGMVLTGSMIILGEVLGKKSGYAFIVSLLSNGVSNVTAPLITAAMLEHFSWKMAFWCYVPISATALLIIFFSCPDYRAEAERPKMDKGGIVLACVSLSVFVSALALAGSYFPWRSPVIIGMLVLGGILFAGFVLYEGKLDQNIAIMPVKILKSRLMVGCSAGQFSMAFNSVCLLTYVAYYMQVEMGASPARAGMSFSMNYAVTVVGGIFLLSLMAKKQNYRAFGCMTVFGEMIALILILVFLSPDMDYRVLFVLICFYGAMASVETWAFVMTVQAGLTRSKVAVGTAMMTFLQNLAGITATSISGSIVNSSASFGDGVRNVYLMAAIVTTVGAIVFTAAVPRTGKLKAMAAAAQEKEDAGM